MVLSKTIQKNMLKKRVQKMGVESDLIDLHSHTDSKLGLRENWDHIKKLASPLKTRSSFISGRISSANYSEQAAEIHANRSNKAKQMDEKLRAKETFSIEDLSKKEFNKWRKKPNRFDIENIDHFGF